MTTLEETPSAEPEAAADTKASSAPGRASAPPASSGAKPSTALKYVGMSVSLAALFVVGFVAYLFGLSSVSEARVQNTMYRTFAGELGQAVAPVGATQSVQNADGTTSTVPLAEGAPMAILNIPQINLKNAVIVQGTTSRDLTRGPGHLPSTVFPGQQGISIVVGKTATFGAPFAHIMDLNRGDRFTVTTGQGIATYSVESFGTSDKLPPDTSQNQVVLVTANSSYIPTKADMVTADLVSSPQPDGTTTQIGAVERNLAIDAGSLIPLLLWSQALLIASVAGALAASRWPRWPVYLAAAPVVIALTWCVYENLAGLLPNVY